MIFSKPFRSIVFTILLVLAFMLFIPAAASANTGETMPWDQGLTVIMNALSGTTVKVIGVILIIGAGIMLAVSEGAAVKRIAWVVVGLGIALNAASFLTMLFGNVSSGFEIPAIKTSLHSVSKALSPVSLAVR
jgi:type IV secretory pathway VirB2 component (pilin)